MTKIKTFTHLFLLIIAFSTSGRIQALDNQIRINTGSGGKANYVIKIIEAALASTQSKYVVSKDPTPLTQSRIAEEVKNGNLDLMWVSTSKEYEQDFTPLRYPLLKGLLGYRVLLIRKGDQIRFENVKTKEDLIKFSFGQGRTWTDSKILKANGFNIIEITKTPGLFYMLDGGRFDAFPRGVSEAFEELQKYHNLPLTVENNLLLAYKMPFYIFVSKRNPELAAELEMGLSLIIKSGEFDNIFNEYQAVIDAKTKIHFSKRRIILLDNPFLPNETPLNRSELWLDPKSFD